MTRSFLWALGLLLIAGGSFAAEETATVSEAKESHFSWQQLDPSLRKDALHAMSISRQWLIAQQQEDGCWSNPAFPAMSGLAISAIRSTPDIIWESSRPPGIQRGLDYIMTKVQTDGSIYQEIEGMKGGGLPNYNTAICLMALAEVGDPDYGPVIEKGREWLIKSQYLGGGVYNGGMGYDPAHQRAYADLSNTVLALEALRKTAPVEKDSQAQMDWDAAIEFVSHCQHLRQTNDAEWVSETLDQKGGFVYHPEKSQADGVESADGREDYFRSYGSMTYAGLLSFIYAEVEPEDARVKAAVDWVGRTWTLDENPNMGEEGLYYYYHTMAKALNARNVEVLELPDGRKVAWREAFIRKIISLQKIDPKTGLGYWQNDNNRWWENDPVLVTAYTLKALSLATMGDWPSR